MKKSLIPFLVLLLLLSACKVGPDYQEPSTPMPESFIEERADECLLIEDDNLTKWWTAFNDPFLDELLEEALRANFDYKIALQRINQARSQYWIQFTQLLPDFEFQGEGARSRSSETIVNRFGNTNGGTGGNSTSLSPPVNPLTPLPTTSTLSPIQNFFQAGFDAIWEIDVFGGLRRAADASEDLWEATIEESRSVKLIILSETAKTYVQICNLQKQTALAEEVVQLDLELVRLFETQFEAGLADEQATLSALANLEKDQAILKANQIVLKQTIYSLAVLLGRWPECLVEDFSVTRPIPFAQGMIPCSLPSELLRRRPDIRTAERELAAATEQIGVAVADLYPKLSLVGSSASFASNPLQGANIGYASSSLNKLFSHPSLIWGIGGLVTWPVFDFGRRLSAVDVQRFARNEAFLNYQKIVIEALQETEQALVSYYIEEQRLEDLKKAAEVNRKILDLNADLFQAGLADYTQVLNSQETWLSSLSELTASQQALTTDVIAVYKALGGDW